jgi:hypothetical protein
MITQWTAKGNRDSGSSCPCDRGLNRYLRSGGWVGLIPSPRGTPLDRSVSRKLFLSSTIVCGRCSWCRGFPTDVGYYGKTVNLTECFSRSFLVTRNWRFNSWRTWVLSRVRCSVTSTNEIRRGPQTPIVLTDLGGDVERVTAYITNGNTTFPQIPAYRREQRLVPCAVNFLHRHRHVNLFMSSVFPQTGMVPQNTDHV